jgi:hypothetical protein
MAQNGDGFDYAERVERLCLVGLSSVISSRPSILLVAFSWRSASSDGAPMLTTQPLGRRRRCITRHPDLDDFGKAFHSAQVVVHLCPVVKMDSLVLSNISRLREAEFDTPSNLLAICNA